MKTIKIELKVIAVAVFFGICAAGTLSGIALATRVLSSHADVVVRIDSAKGLVSIRDAHTGRVMAFKASAADLASMKVGDEVKANWKTGALTEIKGVAKTAALIEPDPAQTCCNVVAVVKDRATMNALLGGVFAEPRGGNADPVTPINDIRGKIKGIDAVNGVQADFGSILDGAEPIGAIVIARNNSTGAMHMLNMSVLPESEVGHVAAPITSSVKIGDPVSIDAATGIAMLKSGNGLYAFNLRGIKKTAEPIGAMKGPWIVEPDASAEGRYGIVRTKWHDKVGSGYQRIYVYLIGKRDQAEYTENWKQEHKVMEGEYDIFINGMLLEKVPIKAGHATRILMGALHSTAAYSSQLHILDLKDRAAGTIQGLETTALPIGTHHVKVGTRTMNVVIKENEVTEF